MGSLYDFGLSGALLGPNKHNTVPKDLVMNFVVINYYIVGRGNDRENEGGYYKVLERAILYYLVD